MEKLQFLVLYRQFIFRLVDPELLSANALGGAGKLLGQFAALLVATGVAFAVVAGVLLSAPMPTGDQLIASWTIEHFLIATTMLVVGLFAILSWDSTFPDRRDVFVLGPLPIRARTVFLSKIAAVATCLAISVAALHCAAGVIVPLTLTREVSAQLAPSIDYDPPLPPVDTAGMKAVLDRDLASALSVGHIAQGRGNGISIGVVRDGVRRFFTYGTARPGSIFQIGSISQTFTGLMLAQMAVQGRVRLDEPVRNLLPADTVNKPAGEEIALLDLATHHSGLTPMPDSLVRNEHVNPYTANGLYYLLSKRGVAKSGQESFQKSNLGVGLLGLALANRAGTSYEDLLRELVTGPLHLTDTVIDLSPAQQSRTMRAYDPQHPFLMPWDLPVLVPAASIRSTAGDMLSYVEANLHPERLKDAGTLPAALVTSHEPRAGAPGGTNVALNWMFTPQNGTWWHDGSISGYTSYVFFDPAHDAAAVVLCSGVPNAFRFTNTLGEHIRARFAGVPAISLKIVKIPERSGSVFEFICLFSAYWLTMLGAGTFIFCCVLSIQGLTALMLPRSLFLRISPFLQMAAFCTLIVVYFLEPKSLGPGDISAKPNYWYIEWSPTYWFLGMFQRAAGSPALGSLARRAWIGLICAVVVTAFAYALSYMKTMKSVVEQPDIAPARRGSKWLPRFGDSYETAVGQFSARTLIRSKQHRLIVGFYLAVGFAATVLLVKTPLGGLAWSSEAAGDLISNGILGSTLTMLVLWIVGTRVAFSLPVDIGANWIFRVASVPLAEKCVTAIRRTYYALSVVPMCVATVIVLFSMWPRQAAAQHIVVMVLLGIILVELCLRGDRKLPFTCSYLPGKSNFHMTFLLCSGVAIALIATVTQVEHRALETMVTYCLLVGVLGAAAVGARWRTLVNARSVDSDLRFEDEGNPAIFSLDLHGRGDSAMTHMVLAPHPQVPTEH